MPAPPHFTSAGDAAQRSVWYTTTGPSSRRHTKKLPAKSRSLASAAREPAAPTSCAAAGVSATPGGAPRRACAAAARPSAGRHPEQAARVQEGVGCLRAARAAVSGAAGRPDPTLALPGRRGRPRRASISSRQSVSSVPDRPRQPTARPATVSRWCASVAPPPGSASAHHSVSYRKYASDTLSAACCAAARRPSAPGRAPARALAGGARAAGAARLRPRAAHLLRPSGLPKVGERPPAAQGEHAERDAGRRVQQRHDAVCERGGAVPQDGVSHAQVQRRPGRTERAQLLAMRRVW